MAYSVAVVIIVLMIWDLILSDHGYFVFKGEYQQQQNLSADIKSLQEDKEKLKTEIIRLREDPKVLEEVIHRELGYVHSDEYMLIMPKTKQDKSKEIQERSGHE